MAEQSGPETMADVADPGVHGPDTQVGPSHVHEARHGRPASWVATSSIIAGFIAGGIALCIGPAWWLFWTGAGLVVLGALVGVAVHMMDDWY